VVVEEDVVDVAQFAVLGGNVIAAEMLDAADHGEVLLEAA
jgi:hypothetical protein